MFPDLEKKMGSTRVLNQVKETSVHQWYERHQYESQ